MLTLVLTPIEQPGPGVPKKMPRPKFACSLLMFFSLFDGKSSYCSL
jgi:hypothetical protein